MEQLDLVYNTFTNLEKNYAHSKKSRKEYLLDKFGGDITVGGMIILDALSRADLQTTEDVEKLSKIRDIFATIAENQVRLDTLSDFDFGTSSGVKLSAILDNAFTSGTGMKLVVGQEATKKPYVHFRVTPAGAEVVPMSTAPRLYAYSKAMVAYAQAATGEDVKLMDIFERKIGNRFVKVKDGEVNG